VRCFGILEGRGGDFCWKLDLMFEACYGGCGAGFDQILPNSLKGFSISAWRVSHFSLGLQRQPGLFLSKFSYQ